MAELADEIADGSLRCNPSLGAVQIHNSKFMEFRLVPTHLLITMPNSHSTAEPRQLVFTWLTALCRGAAAAEQKLRPPVTVAEAPDCPAGRLPSP